MRSTDSSRELRVFWCLPATERLASSGVSMPRKTESNRDSAIICINSSSEARSTDASVAKLKG